MNIKAIKKLFFLSLISLVIPNKIFAYEKSIEIIMGMPEVIDLKFGIENKYFGIGVSPGISTLIISGFKKKSTEDEVAFNPGVREPVFNPSIYLNKKVKFHKNIFINPNFTFTYFYGYGGTNNTYVYLASDSQKPSNSIRTRIDNIYFKESIGFLFNFEKWFFQINPGFTHHLKKEHDINKKDNSELEDSHIIDGIWGALSIGKYF